MPCQERGPSCSCDPESLNRPRGARNGRETARRRAPRQGRTGIMRTVHANGTARRVGRAALALLVAGGLVLTAGCSGRGAGTGANDVASGEGAAGAQVERFAIVTPEKESDHGWNQQGLLAAQAAAEQLGIELDEHEGVGYDNTETILTQVAQSDNQLVIAH